MDENEKDFGDEEVTNTTVTNGNNKYQKPDGSPIYDLATGKMLIGLMHDAPETQLEPEMVTKLMELTKSDDVEIVKNGLHEVLDLCARYALASSFVMVHLGYTWRGMGGLPTDPTPWRDDPKHGTFESPRETK